MRSKLTAILYLIVLLLLFSAAGYLIVAREGRLAREIDAIECRINELQQVHDTNKEMSRMIQDLQGENRELYLRVLELEEWIGQWGLDEAEVTFYAPLDPRAEAGMCFEGDPRVTASGAPVEVGVTAAAGPSVPFGTVVLVEGVGPRVVQDRGGRIGDGHIDVAVDTVAEALRLGRETVLVAYMGVE